MYFLHSILGRDRKTLRPQDVFGIHNINSIALLKAGKGRGLQRRLTGSIKCISKMHPWRISLKRETPAAFKLKLQSKKYLYMGYFYMPISKAWALLLVTYTLIPSTTFQKKTAHPMLCGPHHAGGPPKMSGPFTALMRRLRRWEKHSKIFWSSIYFASYVFLLGQWLSSDINNLHSR